MIRLDNHTRRNPSGLLLLALCAFVAFTAAGCHNYYKEGLEALKAGKIDDAYKEVRAGIKEDPTDPDLRLLMAKILVERGSWAGARNHARFAVKAMPDNAEAHATLARVQARLGAVGNAADHFLDAMAISPGSVKADRAAIIKLLPKAIAFATSEDQPQKAERYILSLGKLQPDAPDASDDKLQRTREHIGQKLTRTGRYDEAEAHYKTLTETYPDKDSYLAERATLLLMLGKDAEADKVFEVYANKGSDKAERFNDAAERANLRNRRDKAESYWGRSLEINEKQPEVLLKLAVLKFVEGDPEAAYEHLALSIGRAGNTPEAHIQAADVALDHDRGDNAIELLQRGLTAASPSFPLTRKLMDLLLRRERRGDMEASLKTWLGRVEDADRQKATLEAIKWLRGRGEHATAGFYLKTLIADPNAPADTWLQLAAVEAIQRRYNEAAVAVESFIKASAGDPAAYLAAAKTLIAAEMPEDAEQILTKGLAKHKKNASLLELSANVYDNLGDSDKAFNAWRQWIDTQADKGRALIKIGRKYAARGDVPRAELLLKEAAKIKGHAPEAWLQLGELYKRRGMDKEMNEAFEFYLDNSEDRETALRKLLDSYEGTNRAPDALKVLDALIKLHPKDPELHYDVAKRHLALGNAALALEALKLFIKLSKEPIGATRRASRLLTRKGQMRLALELYEHLIKTVGDDPEMLSEIGDLYWDLSLRFSQTSPAKSRQYEEASMAFYTKFIDQFKGDEAQRKDLLALAEKLTKRRKFALARRAYEKMLSLDIKLNSKHNFSYGEALLGLGAFEEAQDVFSKSLRSSRNKGAQNFKIGEAFFRAEAYDRALIHLQRVLDQDAQTYVTRAFEMMSRIYIQTGQKKKLQPLIIKTLSLAQGSFNMRQVAASTYTQAGMWDNAIEEYSELLRLRPNNVSSMKRLAEVVYMSGNTKAAKNHFEDAAKASSNPGQAWETIGGFYLARGELDLALDALTKAIGGGGASAEALVQQGLILILKGDYSKGDEALRKGLAMPVNHEEHHKLIVETLGLTPRRDLTLAYTQQAMVNASGPSAYAGLLIEAALDRGDVSRALRISKKAGISANNSRLIPMLQSRGFTLEAINMLRSEIRAGNIQNFERAIIAGARAPRDDRPTPLKAALEHGGLDRLPMFYRPILEQTGNAAALHSGLGLLYTELERRDKAIVHLAAASAEGPRTSNLELGQLYHLSGDKQRARSAFARYARLFENKPASFQRAVFDVVWAYIFLGDLDEAESFTRSIMARPARGSLMVPVLTEIMLMSNRRAEALDLIRNGHLGDLFKASHTGESATSASKIGDLIEATEILAGYGFGNEGLKLLADATTHHKNQASLTLALVEIAARQSDTRAAKYAADYLSTGNSISVDQNLLKIRLAEAWRRGNDHTRARSQLLELVGSYDAIVARKALLGLVALARRTSDSGLLKQALDAHTKGRANLLEASLDQGRMLRLYGFYQEAAASYQRALSMNPTNAGTLKTLADMQRLSGSGAEMLESHKKAARAQRNLSHKDRIDFGMDLTRGPDTELASLYWASFETTSPSMTPRLLGAARVAYLRGDAAAGRSALDELLEDSKRDLVVLDEVLRLLVQLQRWDEVHAIVAKYAPATTAPTTIKRGTLSPLVTSSYLYIGLASYAKGDRTKAFKQFDIYTNVSTDRLRTNLEVAEALRAAAPSSAKSNDVLQDSLTYVERAMRDVPDAPLPYLRRGELRLELGQVSTAKQDFDAYLKRGDYNHLDARRRIALALLNKGEVKDAERHLLSLARHPFLTDGRGLSLALSVFEDSGRFGEGLAFASKHFPNLAANPHVRIPVLFRLAELFAGSGDIDRAIALYERGMERYPDNDLLPNNLAYLMARSGKNLDRAEKLVLQALGARQLPYRTKGIYLDTLAWIHQKQGKHKEALTEQLQALRLTVGNHADAVVLYAHLADIYESLGQSDKANEARYRAGLHDHRNAPILPDF